MTKPIALIFGYGSLLAPHSINRTIPGFLESNTPLVPVTLAGWKRTWTAVYPNEGELLHADNTAPDGIAYMNVEPDSSDEALGIVFTVDEEGIAALDKREKLYDRVDVTTVATFLTNQIPPHWKSLPILTYSATSPWKPDGAIATVGIRRDYRELIREAGILLDREWKMPGRFERDYECVNERFANFRDVIPPVDARYKK
ncbi:MAG: gamma-glutamylcyclotransferase [Candidatus Sumerlaeia bacterium]|nr:gamma-glutamylcyclotransferase [Candidatus Sumerlaeia bacterium]